MVNRSKVEDQNQSVNFISKIDLTKFEQKPS